MYDHCCQSLGELLPSDLRSLGCGILGVLDNISLFISVKVVPSLHIGNYLEGADRDLIKIRLSSQRNPKSRLFNFPPQRLTFVLKETLVFQFKI